MTSVLFTVGGAPWVSLLHIGRYGVPRRMTQTSQSTTSRAGLSPPGSPQSAARTPGPPHLRDIAQWGCLVRRAWRAPARRGGDRRGDVCPAHGTAGAKNESRRAKDLQVSAQPFGGTAKISTKPRVGRPRRASRPSPVLAAGSGRQRDCLFSEAVDQVFRPKASGSLKSERGWLQRTSLL